MKKRILSVFLTAAILFGAASLSALGASNKIFTGEKSRYKTEGEVYKAYDELYGLTENRTNALDNKESAEIDQSQTNWKLICNNGYTADRDKYYKIIFNDNAVDSNYVAVSPVVKPDDFKYKFGAVLSKDSKRLILSPVHSNDIGGKNRSTASLSFTAPKSGKVVLYDFYGDAITAMTGEPFYSFLTKNNEYHAKYGEIKADINFYHNEELLKTVTISETVRSVDFPDLGEIEVSKGDTLKIEVLYKKSNDENGYGAQGEKNAISINPAVAYTIEYLDESVHSYSAYEYLNKFVSDTVNYPDKTEITDFSLSAPWSMKYVNPDNNKDLTTKISVVRNVKPKWTENGFGSTDGIGYYSTSNGNNDNIHTIFHDGKLLINSRYDKKTDFGPRATALRFTAPKSGEIIIKNDGKIKVFSESPVWAGGVSSVKTRINLNGKTVEGSEQESTDGNKGFDFDEVKLEVKEGDVVDFLAWSESTTYAYTDFAPVISYLKYSESGSGTESGDKPGTEPGSEPGNKPGGSEDAKNNILFSYAAYEYLNKVVEENKAAITDGKVKLTSDSFKASAPWSVAFSAPTGGNPWYSKTIYLKDKFSFVGSGSAGVSKYALTGESSGGNECMFVAFDDGKLVINGSYKANALNGYITSLKFTAPKSGNIELSSETLTCMKDAPYWANTDHTTTFNIKKNDAVLKIVSVTYTSGKPTSWSVDGVEQADAAPAFPTVSAEVKKGDILTVEVTQGGESNKSCVAIRPIVKYTSYETNGLNVLAIGNSSTAEATGYLYKALSAVGVKEIKIGAYISENALSAYANEISEDLFYLTGDYTLCNNGVSGTAEQMTLKAAAEKAEWDVVILQSSSEDLNNTEFNKTIAAIKKCFPGAKLAYYATAVPFGEDTHYKDHTDISDKAVLNVTDSVDYYIPVGTAIENCRTSYLGNRLKISGGSIIDGFQSDNGTMSETAKLIAAMTFAEELCDQVADWKYDSFSDVIKNETEFEIVKAAVRRAVMRPYRVTQYAEDTSVTLSGDANCDGKVNICDLVRYGEFTARVNGTEVYKANCDTVKDNRLDEQDLTGIKKLLLDIR